MRAEGQAAIGIDIGGTNIRAARIGADGRVQDRRAVPTQRDGAACLSLCLDLIAQLRTDDVGSIGVGVPGQVDFPAQRVLSGGYVDLSTLPFADRLATETGLPVTIDNDANMALLAEVAQGAAKGLSHVVLLTIGTGIGGAILDSGRILRGRNAAGQLGHLTVVPDGQICVCGRRGCVETESSGTAFGLHLAKAGLDPATRAQTLLAQPDDPVAQQVLHDWVAPLRSAIDTLIATVSPQAVIIGGGVGAASVAALGRVPPRASWFDAPVLAAALGDDAGVIGAALAGRPKGRRAILVNGVPASGKSHVARAMADRMGWPILSLDTVKNPFLVELAPVDRTLNRTLGRAAYRSIFDLIASFPPDATVIIDAWFGFQPPEVLQAGLGIAGVTEVAEIWCHAPPETIGARYAGRVDTRPAGHPGLDYVPELIALATRAKPTGLYRRLDVDTTVPTDVEGLLAFIARQDTPQA